MHLRVVVLLITFFAFLTFPLTSPSPSLFRKVPILARTRSRVKKAITFSRQNDAGSRASPIYCWENLVLVVVLVLESKDKFNHWFIILLYHYKPLCASWQVSLEGHLVLLCDTLNEQCNIFLACLAGTWELLGANYTRRAREEDMRNLLSPPFLFATLISRESATKHTLVWITLISGAALSGL